MVEVMVIVMVEESKSRESGTSGVEGNEPIGISKQ